MDREIQTTLRVAAAAVRIFDDLGIPLVVVGSVAGIVHQHTRRTHDIDLLADVQPAHVRRLAQALALEWDVQDEVIQEALDKAQRFHSDPDFDRRWRPSFNVGHRATGRRLDVFIPIGDRYERVQLQRRIRADLPSGPLWVVSIEDALLAKAQWAHINGEFSPHQWEDAQALVRTLALNHGDQERVKEYVRGVRDTYRKAREGVAVAGWARLNDRDRPLIDDSTAKRLDLLLRHRNPIFSFEPERKTDETPWIIGLEDLLGEPDEPEDWIVEGLLLKPPVNLVCGPPKTFKSLLVQELAMAVASGTSAFGVFTVKEPRTVIYIQEESSRGALRRRFKAALLGRGMHPSVFEGRLQIVTNKEFQLDNPAHIEALVRQGIEAHGAALCIFDPLVEMHNVNENTDEMRPILRVFKRIRNDYGVSSIVVHHNNKNPLATSNAAGIRGWSGIWGMMDGGIFVKDDDADPAQKRIDVTLKEGGQAEPFIFRPEFSDGAMRFNAISLAPGGRTISDDTIVQALRRSGWVDLTELSATLGITERRLRARINAMADRGTIARKEARTGRVRRLLYGPAGATDDDPDF